VWRHGGLFGARERRSCGDILGGVECEGETPLRQAQGRLSRQPATTPDREKHAVRGPRRDAGATRYFMAMVETVGVENLIGRIPVTMRAAVYRGVDDVRLEEVPVPEIGAGEMLVRVHTCGICGTDLKKISTGSHSAPRIFGHETSGLVAKVGAGVREYSVGDRVMVFHHIPCRECYYCRHKTFAQCATYKKVGCTAGFEPSGGGFSEYVRVMDWIVRKGTVRIPDGISFEQACFVEPVNTCIKGIETLRLEAGETVLVIGQGPIGMILAMLAKRAGARVITSDLYPARLTIAKSFGLNQTINASQADAGQSAREMTEGRGADVVILAVGGSGLIRPAMDAARPGGRVLLFAQTTRGEVTIDPAAVCVDEKTLLGSYSASVDLQEESVQFVMNREMDLERLISHRFPLERSVEALKLAAHPQPDSMKIVIQPGSTWAPGTPEVGLRSSGEGHSL
jgi:L-iditol 2-dehydrogenase